MDTDPTQKLADGIFVAFCFVAFAETKAQVKYQLN
jgi:hypothetical protein